MYYALVHYPNIPTTSINTFREKYDPYYPGVNTHITLVFPIPVTEISEDIMKNHIRSALRKWKPFDIHLVGFEKAVDHWLFLSVKEGNKEIVKLHDELYTGPLEKYLRPDLPFAPHVALGLFIKEGSNYNLENPTIVELDEKKCEKALEEAKRLNLDYRAKIESVNLIMVKPDMKTVVKDEKIKLF